MRLVLAISILMAFTCGQKPQDETLHKQEQRFQELKRLHEKDQRKKEFNRDWGVMA